MKSSEWKCDWSNKKTGHCYSAVNPDVTFPQLYIWYVISLVLDGIIRTFGQVLDQAEMKYFGTVNMSEGLCFI